MGCQRPRRVVGDTVEDQAGVTQIWWVKWAFEMWGRCVIHLLARGIRLAVRKAVREATLRYRQLSMLVSRQHENIYV